MIQNNRGLVKLILVILIGVVALSYFGFNLRAIVEAPQTQENLSYVWGLVTTVWNNYLAKPALYLWREVFVDLIWERVISRLKN